ncbi:MAG: fasciclin domain-containing protein [Bacteroidaceae bacterium]|nr:fasciclin domain-containing protein [Bacteroidaceae bacterium]
MNTVLKNRILLGASLVAMMFSSASCVDDTGLKVTSEMPNADKTIYEIIKNDSELTNFVEILDSCDRLDGESVADSLFNKSRVYTLWAPTNNALDEKMKDSIINEIKNGEGRDEVMRTFVESHIANNLHPAKGRYEEREFVLMLNGKRIDFKGSYEPIEGLPYDNSYEFGGVYLKSVNNRAWNGMIHKLDKISKYKFNVFEALAPNGAKVLFGGDEGIDSVSQFLMSYNKTEFSSGLSTLGPIVNGEQTYLDSVFVTSNILLNTYNGVGNIDSEDSVYTFYLPTNKVWRDFLSKYESHYNYYGATTYKPQGMDEKYLDSIKYVNPRLNMIKYLSFSNLENEKYVPADSIMVANTDRYNKRLRLSREYLESCVAGEYSGELSNGYIKTIKEIPYTIFELWHDTIKVQGENDGLRYSVSAEDMYPKTVTKEMIRKDHNDFGKELAGSTYYELKSNGRPVNAAYKLPNVKSATYDVALVTVPNNLEEDVVLPTAKTNVSLTVRQFVKELKLLSSGTYELNVEKIDTLYLRGVRFPICENYGSYSAEHSGTDIQLSTALANQDETDADLSLRIDEILLIPVEDK